ncbi:hypothetical protein AC579_10428 [Pseudocercospora musae]|uniref:NAD(P)-binding protein n=1 Tax=Pseudocercospora musae TaxID=113226 RepID=A0A139IKU7_9PEZI|nr:hypothetical protein AC579_10428 [Pseudocercospora musae]
MLSLPDYTGVNFTPTVHHDVPPSLSPANQVLPSPFVVCITGASRGIGAAAAVAFAQAGASGLILTARHIEGLQVTNKLCLKAARLKALKVEILVAEAGADEEPARKIASVAENDFGRLDVLINNAGVLGTHPSAFAKHTHDIELSQIQTMMNINYIGRFVTTKHLMPLMLASPNGAKSIINISSAGSHIVMQGAPTGFCISALAANRLTEYVAEAYLELGVLTYSVHPGDVPTTPSPPGIPDWMKKGVKDDAGLCGAFCIWLVKKRRDWLNGRYLSANWDVDELEAKKNGIIAEDKLKMRMVV